MNGRSTASRSDSMNGALAGARRTLFWGFLTQCAIDYLISRPSSSSRRVVDGVKVGHASSALFVLPGASARTPVGVAGVASVFVEIPGGYVLRAGLTFPSVRTLAGKFGR